VRVLVVSNYYPPLYIGGYELGCSEVVETLQARGHTVTVLTSTYRIEDAPRDETVSRSLKLTTAQSGEGGIRSSIRLLVVELGNRRAFKRACDRWMPDIVYFWNMQHLSLSLVWVAQGRGLPVSLYVSDPWLSKWEADWWYSFMWAEPRRRWWRNLWALIRAGVRMGGLLPSSSSWLHAAQTQFCSEFLKRASVEAGWPVDRAKVIHWGTRMAVGRRAGSAGVPPRRLLYVGQIIPFKDVHIAVECLHLLIQQGCDLTLTIVGGSVVPEYETFVRNRVRELDVERFVDFKGALGRQEVLRMYLEHDILLFPSSYDEPFALTPLEAMMAGMAVVGTTTGGSRELFNDGDNALTFPKGDSAACARQVKRLLEDVSLFERVRRSGQRTVTDKFRLETMVDKIEGALREEMSQRSR
jgi:glycosyltransferase involved in cell wall biosynthesis